MNKVGFFLFILSLFMMGVNTAYANVPSVTNLKVSVETQGRILTITVTHSNPSINHYISKIEVKVGEDTMVVELGPQSTSVFTEEIEIAASGDVQVRAYCIVHGWSSWASLGGDSDPVDAPSGGISGFPLLALGLGVIGLILLRSAQAD
ncbi:MAG: hypothetical protein ABID54_12955 [Pseudomonadota bacterium]